MRLGFVPRFAASHGPPELGAGPGRSWSVPNKESGARNMQLQKYCSILAASIIIHDCYSWTTTIWSQPDLELNVKN